MATNEIARKPTKKKLTLKKQTIRDLTTKRNAAAAVRGGLPPTYRCGGGAGCTEIGSGCN
jgi:hypothetical protein